MHNPVSVRITEIFHSIQGESSTVGIPTVFIRLTGCPLRCVYCDTEYAFSGGKMKSLEEIQQLVSSFKCNYITVTGGEPLAQPACLPLLRILCDQGYRVSLETGGAMPIEGVDKRVCVVMDLKTPGSREASRNREENIGFLKSSDQIKFVICDRQDYEWSKAKFQLFDLGAKVGEVLFSPSFGQLPSKLLAEWILEDKLAVRMQLQMHKLIWGDEPGH